jgi:formate dehydrogenase subunit beta
MTPLPPFVREQIAAWLAAGEIELFIGYEAGPLPLRATPTFIREPAEVERLIWDATCAPNLAAFLPRYRGRRVGLMVKGCDAHAVVGLEQEGQVERANLRLVGAPCPGVIDPRRAAARLGLGVDELEDVAVEGDWIVAGSGERLPLAEVRYAACASCTRRTPQDADLLLGQADESRPDESRPDGSGPDEPGPDEPAAEPFAAVHAMEALDADGRWARFSGEVARCTLCYACRNACPLCYCTVCFADRTQPRWFSQTAQPADAQFFQLMRTFHLAGRCVGCGACTRACPQGIDLRLFLDKLRLDVAELYGYEAGLDPAAKPPLTTYRADDPDDFTL